MKPHKRIFRSAFDALTFISLVFTFIGCAMLAANRLALSALSYNCAVAFLWARELTTRPNKRVDL